MAYNESKGESKDVSSVKQGQVQKPAASLRVRSPFDEMDRLFENFFPQAWGLRRDWPSLSEAAAQARVRVPAVDVVDRDNEIVLRAEVPGFEKQDLEISVTDNSISIKGSTRHEEKEEKGSYYRCEISRDSFSRTVALPSDVDAERAKATFKDGVLEVTAPKLTRITRRTVKVE